ncbi:hypothetical protein RclHR1_43890001 [Rhizophagus clarus]|uniref:DNA-directed DNA polymerase n=1 Tax=Rhizophagus clarus TaxID=94130 RepID=A0A2Z6RUF9_9GLOM|nr:hypothetical protein RclHR1_43890001 [Rhizophagus clarus]
MACNNESDEKKFLKKIRSSNFKYGRPLGDTLVGAYMGKASVVLNKPIIVRVSVLKLSKLLIYRFWYNYVKEKYGDKARLGYMDTDFFIFMVETEDIYKDMAERPDIFDLNDSKTIGFFEDETPGNVITESFHIQAKSYHYVLANKSTKLKHKGVSKKGMNEMAENTYPENHVRSLVESEKKALCPIDTKHWILLDGITTLPYGHWCIMIYKNMVKADIPHEQAEKRAMKFKLPEKYQNEYVSHISSHQQ